jgi:hypothetical protein
MPEILIPRSLSNLRCLSEGKSYCIPAKRGLGVNLGYTGRRSKKSQIINLKHDKNNGERRVA